MRTCAVRPASSATSHVRQYKTGGERPSVAPAERITWPSTTNSTTENAGDIALAADQEVEVLAVDGKRRRKQLALCRKACRAAGGHARALHSFGSLVGRGPERT